jgi:hypothetical protein
LEHAVANPVVHHHQAGRRVHETLMVCLLALIAVGSVVAMLLVQNGPFTAEAGLAFTASVMVMVFYAARQLNVSPAEAAAMVRPSALDRGQQAHRTPPT